MQCNFSMLSQESDTLNREHDLYVITMDHNIKTKFDSFLHPVLGGIVSLVARVPILPVDEVTTDFKYEVELEPGAVIWYKN